MEWWIELGVWAALVGAGVRLAWPRDVEPRWVRFVERGLPVRGRWARRLSAAPFLLMSLFPFVQTPPYVGNDRLHVTAGHYLSYPCFPIFPPAPQGVSYACSRQLSGVQTLRLRIGFWETHVTWVADADRN